MHTGSGSRGFALAIAVFALVLIAALLAGVFFAAQQELRLGRNALGAERAFAAAEAGLGAVVANWEPARRTALHTGESAAFSGALPAGTGAYTGSVTRLGLALFLVQATGRDAGGGSRRSVAQVLRLAPPALDIGAALTIADRLDLAAASLVSGDDQSPEGWTCPAAVSRPGVRIIEASRISSDDCSLESCLRGSPPVMEDATIGDSLARRADQDAWLALAAVATRTYPPGAGVVADIGPVGTATSCDSSARGNWGDPASPPSVPGCAGFFPVIRAQDDLRIAGGRGQGILLVEGDLVVEGSFEFRGVVLVRGTLSLVNLGGRVLGGVKAFRADLRPAVPGGAAEVRFSSCAVRTVLLANALATPLAPRGWVEVF